ncbi:MAG: rhomboid family intramembrane serine protease [Halioglobus sp.]
MKYHFTALERDISEDLLPLSGVLHQRGVAHRIFEENGRQVVKVGREEQVAVVASLYDAWRKGEFRIERVSGGRGVGEATAGESLSLAGRLAPVTLALIAFSVAGFLLFYFRAPMEWLSLFTFTPFTVLDGQIQFSSANRQYWRLISPAFLHFGWLHIAFNSLWLWELGAKVERKLGSLNMLLLFCTIALVSNSAQFAFGGPGLFGGMSGVVYGLLGFAWAGARLQPLWKSMQPPQAVMVMMVGWLFLCIFGVVEVMGFGAIANAAHLGGLLAGSVLGAAFGALSRSTRDRD